MLFVSSPVQYNCPLYSVMKGVISVCWNKSETRHQLDKTFTKLTENVLLLLLLLLLILLFLGVRDCLLMRLSISKVLRWTSWVLGIVYWILGCLVCKQAFPDLREHFIGSSECFFGAIGHLTFLPETIKYVSLIEQF